MSSMMETAAPDMGHPAGVTSLPPAGAAFVLQRAGSRPLRFEGSELAMAMSYTPEIPFWYEINLYRTAHQTFVTAVRLFHQSAEKQDTVRAWENGSLDDAIDKLSRYDAGYDVPVTLDFDAAAAPPSELSAQAFALQARISEARHHYKSLVGELLYDLESGQQ